MSSEEDVEKIRFWINLTYGSIMMIGWICILCAYYCCCKETCRPQMGSNLFGRGAQAVEQGGNVTTGPAETVIVIRQEDEPHVLLQPPQMQPQSEPAPPEYTEKI
ncbi:hypothetical protein BOX15_Mlig003630g4 [Macrostomum lignano]|uniref:Uncharacterized protein n=1 Tax=Macrostomum lignano TaxID=282301 RepID=A0A267GCK8_9PLAT|nr:hypothetical protein BOX15_Mlig003630g4 [Macrostomum lignano]